MPQQQGPDILLFIQNLSLEAPIARNQLAFVSFLTR
jgi:hypothetical protein